MKNSSWEVDKMESKLIKVKVENEIENNKKSFRSYKVDMTFGELMNLYVNDEMKISPPYQRLFRWDRTQRTNFIESLLLEIPIPPIFVAEDENGKWEVVDGLQRLSTFFSFIGCLNECDDTSEPKNNWKMKEGDLIKSIKGMTYNDLPTKNQLNLKRAFCSVIVIQTEKEDYDTRYVIFNRLNTGGTKLSDQEIRNVIYRGISEKFNEFLRVYGSNDDFKELIQTTQNKIDALFLDELILRFCALYNNSDNIKGNLSQYMTKFMEKIVQKSANDETIIDEYESIFNRTITLLRPLGKDIFNNQGKMGKRFSTSYYDGIMIGVSQNIEFCEKLPVTELNNRIQQLKNDDEFEKYTGTGAQNKRNVIGRINRANEIFSK